MPQTGKLEAGELETEKSKNKRLIQAIPVQPEQEKPICQCRGLESEISHFKEKREHKTC